MIQSPSDLHQLDLPALEMLAADIRQRIVEVCLKNGGHLGASLGPVELALALHRSFQSPEEPIIWDVGHQAYAHKLLTGRWKEFETLRRYGGLSGFLKRDESPHDVFGAGHSSTSLAAALAFAWTRKDTKKWTVAVIGDGGLTAGIAFEALQQLKGKDIGPLLIVINDNQMSISPNVGAIPQLLAEGRADDFFDHFGMDYVGPIDGHDLGQLLGLLEGLKKNYLGRPIVLHTLTQKGKGYAPAEERPAEYHGISPLSSQSKPQGLQAAQPEGSSFSECFTESVLQWARRDSRVVAITAAMPEGTGLSRFEKEFPERFFDVGIAEAYALTFAAGLAAEGWKPIVALYSTFLQRGFDSLIHDIALQNLGVIIGVDRAGLVGPDGPTHHGAYDIAYTRLIPGAEVYAPYSKRGLSAILSELSNRHELKGPIFIRYPRGVAPENNGSWDKNESNLGFSRNFLGPTGAQGASALIISVGHSSAKLARLFKESEPKRQVDWIALETIKPFPPALEELLRSSKPSWESVLVLEEGVKQGGVGEQIIAYLKSKDLPGGVLHLGYPDSPITHGSLGEIERDACVSSSDIKMALAQRGVL